MPTQYFSKPWEVAEIGEFRNRSRRRVTQLTKASCIPQTVLRLRLVAVWAVQDVRAWAKKHYLSRDNA